MRYVAIDCKATIGQVGNAEHGNVVIGKAGRVRHMGIRPTVRGSVMNPCDHPHGGGEGRAPIGRSGPVTPWGKPALGYKTRKKKITLTVVVKVELQSVDLDQLLHGVNLHLDTKLERKTKHLIN